MRRHQWDNRPSWPPPARLFRVDGVVIARTADGAKVAVAHPGGVIVIVHRRGQACTIAIARLIAELNKLEDSS